MAPPKQLRLFPKPPPDGDEPVPSAPDSEVRERQRDRSRSARPWPVPGRSISVRRLSQRELALGRAEYPPEEFADTPRPRTRGECANGPRPCPFVSCSHHLFLDVSARTGSIKLNFPDLEVDELAESCALDVADRKGTTLHAVGRAMNLTRERVRQLEVRALAKLQAEADVTALRDFWGEGAPTSKRRLPVLADDDSEELDPDEFAGDALDE